jgi:3-methyl-2-oxobutanoate hydroxymethyltransferase
MDRVTISNLTQRARKGEKLTLVAAHDHPTAEALEEAGIDVILVSDALGPTALGYDSVFPVSLEEMVHHTRAVARAAKRALVAATLPLGSYETAEAAVGNSLRLVKEAGAAAVELEGNREILEQVRAVSRAGVPVFSHIGLTKQITLRRGGFTVVGREAASGAELLEAARAHEEAGAAALIVECVPDRLAALITRRAAIPVFGIGAGPHCHGQALVAADMLGLFTGFVPKFAKRYADLGKLMREAFAAFRQEAAAGVFPGEEHSFTMRDEEFDLLRTQERPEGDEA